MFQGAILSTTPAKPKSISTIQSILQKLAERCNFAQSGCNILGLSKGFAKDVQALHDAGFSMEEILEHPIYTCWVSKFLDMNHYIASDFKKSTEAFDAMLNMAKGKTNETN